MAVQPPPPPPISPRQLNLLRIVAALAWCDGTLAKEEAELILDRFSHLFAATEAQQAQLRQDLESYLIQNLPLEELTPKLTSQADKELVLRLGYEVISANRRSPDEDAINDDESMTYERLVKLLDLPPDVVARVKSETDAQPDSKLSIIDVLANQLQEYLQRR
jgi:hypothetical protein